MGTLNLSRSAPDLADDLSALVRHDPSGADAFDAAIKGARCASCIAKIEQGVGAIPGVDILNGHFFNEFTLRTRRPAAALIEALARRGVIGGLPVSRLLPLAGLDDLVVVASTEVNTEADRAAYGAALAACLA